MKPQNLNRCNDKRSICNLCETESTILYARMNDRLFGSPGLWDFRQCSNPQCRFVWLDPIPTKSQLNEAYKDYYTHIDPGQTNQRHQMRAYIMRAILRTYTLLLSGTTIASAVHKADQLYLDNIKPGRLLEIGCGDGSTMLKLKQLGWQVEGQEVDVNAARLASRRTELTVHCGELESLDIPNGVYDAIVMIHVIEHVQDPVKLLKECKRLLKTGGTLIVVTPNSESFGHKKFGQYWRDIDAPRHLHIFSRVTLSQVAIAANFNDNTITTTMAHAHYVAGSSIAIQRHEETLDSASKLRWRTAVGAALFQIREAHAHNRDADCGEECVLVAKAHA